MGSNSEGSLGVGMTHELVVECFYNKRGCFQNTTTKRRTPYGIPLYRKNIPKHLLLHLNDVKIAVNACTQQFPQPKTREGWGGGVICEICGHHPRGPYVSQILLFILKSVSAHFK